MSIAINTRKVAAPTQGLVRAYPVEKAILSRNEQLREARGLMRRFVLAFAASGVGLYAIVAAGFTP